MPPFDLQTIVFMAKAVVVICLLLGAAMVIGAFGYLAYTVLRLCRAKWGKSTGVRGQ